MRHARTLDGVVLRRISFNVCRTGTTGSLQAPSPMMYSTSRFPKEMCPVNSLLCTEYVRDPVGPVEICRCQPGFSSHLSSTTQKILEQDWGKLWGLGRRSSKRNPMPCSASAASPCFPRPAYQHHDPNTAQSSLSADPASNARH